MVGASRSTLSTLGRQGVGAKRTGHRRCEDWHPYAGHRVTGATQGSLVRREAIIREFQVLNTRQQN